MSAQCFICFGRGVRVGVYMSRTYDDLTIGQISSLAYIRKSALMRRQAFFRNGFRATRFVASKIIVNRVLNRLDGFFTSTN